jgi:hypothetical protein
MIEAAGDFLVLAGRGSQDVVEEAAERRRYALLQAAAVLYADSGFRQRSQPSASGTLKR